MRKCRHSLTFSLFRSVKPYNRIGRGLLYLLYNRSCYARVFQSESGEYEQAKKAFEEAIPLASDSKLIGWHHAFNASEIDETVMTELKKRGYSEDQVKYPRQ